MGAHDKADKRLRNKALDAFKYNEGSIYTTDEIELAVSDVREDLEPLKEALKGFLIQNHKYLSVNEMGQLLGIPAATVLKLLPKEYHRTINLLKTQTVIIWREPLNQELDLGLGES